MLELWYPLACGIFFPPVIIKLSLVSLYAKSLADEQSKKIQPTENLLEEPKIESFFSDILSNSTNNWYKIKENQRR